MNKQELLNAAEVMRRAANGEPLQAYDIKGWHDVSAESVGWVWWTFKYRIKPKPRVIWVRERDLLKEPLKYGDFYAVKQTTSQRMVRFVEDGIEEGM